MKFKITGVVNTKNQLSRLKNATRMSIRNNVLEVGFMDHFVPVFNVEERENRSYCIKDHREYLIGKWYEMMIDQAHGNDCCLYLLDELGKV